MKSYRKRGQGASGLAMALALAFVQGTASLRADGVAAPPAAVVRLPVPANACVQAGVPVDPFDITLNSFLFGQLTGATNGCSGDLLQVWDYTNQALVAAYRAGAGSSNLVDGAWYADLTHATGSAIALPLGTGFLVSNRQAVAQELWMAGMLPGDSSIALVAPTGFSLMAGPYPEALAFPADSPIGAIDALDVLQAWSATGSFARVFQPELDGNSNLRFTPQSPAGDNGVLDLGQGFWYVRGVAETLSWPFARPYEWLFDTNLTPRIVNACASPASGQIQLTIAAGSADGTFDIFRQNVGPGQNFAVSNTWTMLAAALPISANTSTNWTDTPPSRSGDMADMLVYAVADNTRDSDGDDLPDGREVFLYHTDPFNRDTDSDGIPDGWEVKYGLNPLDPSDAAGDLVGDGVSNLRKYLEGRNPRVGVLAVANSALSLSVLTPLE